MERREPSYTVVGNINWYSMERFLKKLKIELPYNLPVSLLGMV